MPFNTDEFTSLPWPLLYMKSIHLEIYKFEIKRSPINFELAGDTVYIPFINEVS